MMAPLSLLGSLALMSGIAMPASATFNLFLSTQVTFMLFTQTSGNLLSSEKSNYNMFYVIHGLC